MQEERQNGPFTANNTTDTTANNTTATTAVLPVRRSETVCG